MHRTTRSQPLPRTTLIRALALGLFAVTVPLSLFACDVAPQDGEGDDDDQGDCAVEFEQCLLEDGGDAECEQLLEQ
ncbi:MAG: hypothetical protein KC468_21050, partial [Myxococcales bacterium]|nr:hypothetical protein [Myxococcales bacterium]